MSKFPQEELLSAYLDGELSAARRADVEKLLADDASARAMLEELRGVSSALKGLPALKLDEDLGSRVLKIAERRMLADMPADTTAKPSVGPFWRTVGRRFLTPRAIVWPATAVAVAILLTVYGPEEEKHGPKGPIAMDMKANKDAPADRFFADDESIADRRARRGPGEFRAAPPPAAKESAAAVAKKESKKAEPAKIVAPTKKKAAPAKIAEKPAMKRPDAGRHLASKGEPVKTNHKAMSGRSGAGGMGIGAGKGMGGGMGAGTPLADKREPPTITVNCYYVSSPSAAQKALEKILLSQKTPSNKQRFEPSALKWEKPKEKQIVRKENARQRTAGTESASISIEATPTEFEQMLVDIRKQADVFRDCSDDAKSQRHAFGLRQTAQTLDAPPKMPPASDESTNYRVVFVLQSSKSQPAAAPNASTPAK